jgi:hypothetical protein
VDILVAVIVIIGVTGLAAYIIVQLKMVLVVLVTTALILVAQVADQWTIPIIKVLIFAIINSFNLYRLD